MKTLQRYHRLRNEYDHHKRRHRMLHSITIQKRDELENLMIHINQLLLLEDQTNISIQPNTQLQIGPYFSLHDHGDHLPTRVPLERVSTNEDKESDDDDDDDPLLRRLKLTKPSRLKTSTRNILNKKIHTIYDEYLSG
ncbi:unnamed protein product [Rotaria magnacalcarata]